MIGVNLIPDSVLAARARSRRIRQWSAVLLATAAVCAVPMGMQLRRHASIASLSQVRDKGNAEVTQLKSELTQLNQSIQDLEDRIQRAETLRVKRPWARLLAVMTACMPGSLWLTSISAQLPEAEKGAASQAESTAIGSRPGQENGSRVVMMQGARQMSVSGYALEHEHVADFIAGLKQSCGFKGVQLVKADAEPLLQSRAVRFELLCTW